jgi:hypothetical protein
MSAAASEAAAAAASAAAVSASAAASASAARMTEFRPRTSSLFSNMTVGVIRRFGGRRRIESGDGAAASQATGDPLLPAQRSAGICSVTCPDLFGARSAHGRRPAHMTPTVITGKLSRSDAEFWSSGRVCGHQDGSEPASSRPRVARSATPDRPAPDRPAPDSPGGFGTRRGAAAKSSALMEPIDHLVEHRDRHRRI